MPRAAGEEGLLTSCSSACVVCGETLSMKRIEDEETTIIMLFVFYTIFFNIEVHQFTFMS